MFTLCSKTNERKKTRSKKRKMYPLVAGALDIFLFVFLVDTGIVYELFFFFLEEEVHVTFPTNDLNETKAKE